MFRINRISSSLIAFLAAFAIAASPAAAAGGQLDPTFGEGGKVTTDVGPLGEANGVAIQTDGKIVAVGTDNLAEGEPSKFVVTRYNPNGTLDRSFGGTGIVTTDFTPDDDHAFGVAIQPDGKIVVSGYSGLQGGDSPDYTLTKLTIARYNVNGSLDKTFGGGDGSVRTDVGPCDDYGNAVRIQTDGSIVVAGSSYLGAGCDDSAFALTRYSRNGTLDKTFGGGDGEVITDITAFNDFSFGLALQADGKIVTDGIAGRGGPNSTFAMIRFNTDGGPDATFGTGGTVTTDFTPGEDFGDSVAIQSDGRIVVSGNVGGGGGNNDMFGLARYNADGSLDATFGGDGMVTTDFSHVGTELRAAVAIQADGKIVAAGGSAFTGGGTHGTFALARYEKDGTLDETFGQGGKVTTDFTRFDDVAAAVAIRADGTIVVAGVSGIGGGDVRMALARYLSN